MAPNKKKKGCQNKQQKPNNIPPSLTKVNKIIVFVPSPDKDEYARIFENNMKKLPPEDVVEPVRKGMGRSTQVITHLLACAKPETAKGNTDIKLQRQHQKYLVRLLDAGLVSVVLGLLQRCQESFDDVVEAEIEDCRSIDWEKGYRQDMEGRISAPGLWIHLLSNIIVCSGIGNKRIDEIKMQIACDIGPLVSCMCDDVKRELFQSKKYWFNAIPSFVYNLYSIVSRMSGSLDVRKSVVSILSKYDGLTELMIQSIFWGEHRPDIIKEAEEVAEGEMMDPDSFAMVADHAGAFLGEALKSHEQEGAKKFYFEGYGKEMNYKFGTTPIVSRTYDPSCGLIFISGLIGLLRRDKTNAVFASPKFFNNRDIHTLITLLTGKPKWKCVLLFFTSSLPHLR